MWPRPGEALSRTIDAERAIAALYGEALSRWAPQALAAALPALPGAEALTAAVLPPDPDAVQQAQQDWEAHAEAVVVAGAAALWAAAVSEAADDLGVDLGLPVFDLGGVGDPGDLDGVAAQIVARHTGDRPLVVARRLDQVRDALPDALAEFTAATREQAATVPVQVHDKLTAELAAAGQYVAADVPAPERVGMARRRAADVLDPGSPQMAGVAEQRGYQAAAVLNNATVEAAHRSEDADDLEKVWIATLDSKTRHTHFAADGQRVPLGGMFAVGGAELRYPSDPLGPANEVMGCRCRVGILARDEPLPDEVDRHTERSAGDSTVRNRQGSQADEIARRRAAGVTRARDDEQGVGRVAAAAWIEQGEVAMTAPVTVDAQTAEQPELFRTFTDVVLATTGTPSIDGRMLAPGMDLTFRDLPLALQFREQTSEGHSQAWTVGVVESMRFDGERVLGSGYVLNTPAADRCAELAGHGVTWPSLDFGNDRWAWTDGHGVPLNPDDVAAAVEAGRQVEAFKTYTAGKVFAVTLVSTPALDGTTFTLNPEREARPVALVASAAESLRPPVFDARLFADPKLSGPTRLTITEDGHVFGHVACWEDRHRTVGLGHIRPPRSTCGYAHFHSSPAVHLSDGSTLPVGRLTVGIGHAPMQGITNQAAVTHYDNASTCWALVRAGEDRFGIYVSGVVAPWASADQVQMAMTCPVSGDWRPYNGQYELVAVLSVNTPGFLTAAATGRQGEYALVASLGPPAHVDAAGGVEHLSGEQIHAIVMSALGEHDRRSALAARQADLAARAVDAVGAPPTPRDKIGAMLAQVQL